MLNDDENQSVPCDKDEDQVDQQFIVADGFDMLSAYLSIRDREMRQSLKQLVEKIAFANRPPPSR